MIDTQKSVDTSDLSEQEWLSLRRASIGGSEVAGVLGRSKYTTPYQVWLEKSGRFQFDRSNPVTAFGNFMEPHLREHLAEVLGIEVTEESRMYYHPEYPIHANVDGIINDPNLGNGIAEIKTTTSRRVSRLETLRDIPDSWYYQIQHYLGILGDAKFAYLMVFLRDKAQYLDPLKVPRDEEFIHSNNDSLANWWTRYVEADQPPPMSNKEDLKIRYPSGKEGTTVEASEHMVSRYRALKQVTERLSGLKELKQSMEMDLKTAMGDGEQLIHNNELLATWKTQSRNRFDSKTFRRDYPELYRKYTTENQYRIFRLK